YKNKYRPNLNDDIQKALYSLKTLSYEIGKRKMQYYFKSISKDWNLIDIDTYVDVLNKVEKVKKELLKKTSIVVENK
ncbi:hypothetical protein LCGC14_2003040, partial [marine sediment metagenome]